MMQIKQEKHETHEMRGKRARVTVAAGSYTVAKRPKATDWEGDDERASVIKKHMTPTQLLQWSNLESKITKGENWQQLRLDALTKFATENGIDDGSVAEAVASFSPEQLVVWNRFITGKSVFFSGVAGSGKSFLLRTIIKCCRIKRMPVGVTASTGIAGVNIGASTLHSWAGIGFGEGTVKSLVANISKRSPALERWCNAKALIIDELSMISHVLFDKLEQIARAVRQDTRPFGGLQLIMSGDFLQLPPVTPGSSTARHTFLAKSWDKCFPAASETGVNPHIVILTRVFRQTETSFVRALNNARVGKVTAEGEELFRSCLHTDMDALVQQDGIEPTRLFSTKNEVSIINQRRLAQIDEKEETFVATDWCAPWAKYTLTNIQKNCQAAETIVLKVGAQVMFLCNRPEVDLVNGSRGVVIGFKPSDDGKAWPVVRFANGVEYMCVPEEWAIEQNHVKVAKRTQVPLLLAWALTIHKCQGMTLDRVELSLGTIFEKGQGYVALSRVTDRRGLRLLDYDRAVIRACPVAIAWYELKNEPIGPAPVHVSTGCNGTSYPVCRETTGCLVWKR